MLTFLRCVEIQYSEVDTELLACTPYRFTMHRIEKRKKTAYSVVHYLSNKCRTNAVSHANCILSPREPEAMRERECRWKHLPWMLSCNLGRSCLASLAPTFLTVWYPSQNVSCLSDRRLVSRAKIIYSFGHTLVWFATLTQSSAMPGVVLCRVQSATSALRVG